MLLAVAYVLLLAVVALGVPLAISLRDRVDAEIKSQARSQAEVLAGTATELLESNDVNGLGRLTESSASSVRGRVIVVDDTGRVVADSAGGGEIGAPYASRPEIAAALGGKAYQQVRHSDTLSADILATAIPVGGPTGDPLGAVRVTQSVAAVNRAVNRSLIEIALLALVVLGLGLVAGWLLAQRIARPIHRLADTADEVAGGDLETRATIEGSAEQRSLARTFNAMTSRLARLLESQQEFVADASHQLRTPLTGLRLQLEELHELCSHDDPARGSLEAAIHEVDRLSQIVDELLILSRAGEHSPPAEQVSPRAVADRAADRWRKAAAAKQITIGRRSEGAPETVLCAPSDLDRVLDSLLENAVIYSDPGGRITVSDSGGQIAVLDEGPGLAEGEEEAVLERFYRGRAGRQGAEGTGLGLAIAQELASQWGGSVRLSNRRGGGACASLRLPVAPSGPRAGARFPS